MVSKARNGGPWHGRTGSGAVAGHTLPSPLGLADARLRRGQAKPISARRPLCKALINQFAL